MFCSSFFIIPLILYLNTGNANQILHLNLNSSTLEQLNACHFQNRTLQFLIDGGEINLLGGGSNACHFKLEVGATAQIQNTTESSTTQTSTTSPEATSSSSVNNYSNCTNCTQCASSSCVAASTIAGIEGFIIFILVIALVQRNWKHCTTACTDKVKDVPPPVPTSDIPPVPPSFMTHNNSNSNHHIAVAHDRLDGHRNARTTQQMANGSSNDANQERVALPMARLSSAKIGHFFKKMWTSSTRQQQDASQTDAPSPLPKDYTPPKPKPPPSISSSSVTSAVAHVPFTRSPVRDPSYTENEWTKPIVEEQAYADPDEVNPDRPGRPPFQPPPTPNQYPVPVRQMPTSSRPAVAPKKHWQNLGISTLPTNHSAITLNLPRKPPAPEPVYETTPDRADDPSDVYYDVQSDRA